MTDKTNNRRCQMSRRSNTKIAAMKNTKAEFKRLKTILPSIRRKEKVSKLDIILEAIKYIDDLQDQLFDRLTGSPSQREAALLALTEQDMERSHRSILARAATLGGNDHESSSEAASEAEETISDDEDDKGSHASLDLM